MRPRRSGPALCRANDLGDEVGSAALQYYRPRLVIEGEAAFSTGTDAFCRSCRGPCDESERLDRSRDDGAGRNHRKGADGKAAADDGTGSDGDAGFDAGEFRLPAVFADARKAIVGKTNVRADKAVLRELYTGIDTDTVLDSTHSRNAHPGIDVDVLSDRNAAVETSVFAHVAMVPYPDSGS